MLKNKDLRDFMPRSKGNWEEDKDRFIKLQMKVEEGLDNFDVES